MGLARRSSHGGPTQRRGAANVGTCGPPRVDETPIGSITTACMPHGCPRDADAVALRPAPGTGWADCGHESRTRRRSCGAPREGRERLVNLRAARLRRPPPPGLTGSDVTTDDVLDPSALTICFARRFATYKRATLLLSQPERLKALLTSPDRPMQLVFAGKAHPADEQGKEMIRQIEAFSSDPEIRHRFVFVDDYDIAVARALYQGSDVWLNNPRRPQEACGTSGMKSALNGGLNLSILDGWWHEMFDGENGWAISSAEKVEDLDRRDQLEAGALFDLLERQVVPLYTRYGGPVPPRWLKTSASRCLSGPMSPASRMVSDYVAELYNRRGPATPLRDVSPGTGVAGGSRGARRLARRHVDRVRRPVAADLGGSRHVEAVVALGTLAADDVDVQLIHGPVGQADELTSRSIVSMAPAGPADDAHHRYTGSLETEHAGRYGFTLRVVPRHPDGRLRRARPRACATPAPSRPAPWPGHGAGVVGRLSGRRRWPFRGRVRGRRRRRCGRRRWRTPRRTGPVRA